MMVYCCCSLQLCPALLAAAIAAPMLALCLPRFLTLCAHYTFARLAHRDRVDGGRCAIDGKSSCAAPDLQREPVFGLSRKWKCHVQRMGGASTGAWRRLSTGPPRSCTSLLPRTPSTHPHAYGLVHCRSLLQNGAQSAPGRHLASHACRSLFCTLLPRPARPRNPALPPRSPGSRGVCSKQ